MRPLRRRLSSRCTTMKLCTRSTIDSASAATTSRADPDCAARAAASATKPVPIAVDFESTTRTDPPNSVAAYSAAPSVLDRAPEMCTATTPSPPLSCNACRYAAVSSAGVAPAVVT